MRAIRVAVILSDTSTGYVRQMWDEMGKVGMDYFNAASMGAGEELDYCNNTRVTITLG